MRKEVGLGRALSAKSLQVGNTNYQINLTSLHYVTLRMFEADKKTACTKDRNVDKNHSNKLFRYSINKRILGKLFDEVTIP